MRRRLLGAELGPEEHQGDGLLVRPQPALLALLADGVADDLGQFIFDGRRQLQLVDDAADHLFGRRALQRLDRQRLELGRQRAHVHLRPNKRRTPSRFHHRHAGTARVEPSFTGFYWVLLGFTGLSSVFFPSS